MKVKELITFKKIIEEGTFSLAAKKIELCPVYCNNTCQKTRK